MAATQSPVLAVEVAVPYLVIQQIENHFIIPLVMGRALSVHPIVVILAVLVGGELFGIVGVILSAPLVATLAVSVEYILVPALRRWNMSQ